MVAWLLEHSSAILGVLLGLSELVGVVLVLFGKGVPGILAGIIQVLKTLGAKKPELPEQPAA